MTPGEFVAVTFDLMPDDQVIPQGAQLGLMIFASDSEFTLRPVPGTEMTLELKESKITIPVVGGLQALKAAIE